MKVFAGVLLSLCSGLTGYAVAAENPQSGSASVYPNRPIRFVIAQSAGGNADFVARAYAQRLSERLGQQIVIDNRPGGAGVIGTEIVSWASPGANVSVPDVAV